MEFLRKNRALLAVAAIGLLTVALAFSLTARGNAAAAPDFRQYEAGPERKTEFFSYLRPMIEAQNSAVLQDRERLLELAAKDGIGWFDRRWLHDLAERYAVAVVDDEDESRPDDELIEALLLRVDAVPQSLALAQAAKESGWGTSRFAREGNNFYGEWCFEAGCGIVPQSRAAGRSHEVQAFDSPQESVASYLRNINTHSSYKDFRKARKAQRERKQKLSGVELAAELTRYSERREEYVREIRNLILSNDLEDGTAGS